MSKLRIAVAALSLSAAGLISLVASEGYTGKAVIPTKGDRPTVGFGSTYQPDGKPVKLGDTVTPVRALVLVQAHLSKEEDTFRKSLAGASLSQAEYDIYMDFVYQYGSANWETSTIRKNILAGRYSEACDALLMWKKAAGYDCSTPGNTRCPGVWTRQLERHKACKAAQ
jgi:GH24 family phage-related lysozyme (muramidase)